MLKSDANGATKLALIEDFDRVLSLSLIEKAASLRESEQGGSASFGIDAETASEIEALIAERAEAKKAKNYARADEIRNTLAERGIILKDTKDGTTYTVE